MSYDFGGRADKLGNRYEGRWVTRQLLQLLDEQLRSVTIEDVGDDETGVDLWVESMDGARQAQQCKGRNKSKESWSVGDFKHRDIWDKIRSQLDRDMQAEFRFISGVPFTKLTDLCFSARNCKQDSEAFYRLLPNNKNLLYKQICGALQLDVANASDRRKAFDYLRRLRVDLYPDDDNAWTELKTWAGFFITGAPDAVIATLQAYAENTGNLGKPIYSDQLWSYLDEQGFFSKRLARDGRIWPVIEHLQGEFDESIRPGLIGGELIPREEAKSALEQIKDGKGLIILHGSAGVGKSGVLFELTCILQKEGIVYLPIRLDRRIPDKNAFNFGNDIGLPDSPVNCLVAAAGGRPCVLILDQLDAIRWTSAHSSNPLDICRELVRQLLSFRRSGQKVSVVVSCRTFDLNHDPEIHNWIRGGTALEQWTQIEVRPLPTAVVREIVGDQYELLTPAQHSILANPQNLAMWMQLRSEGDLTPFKSSVELLKRFWEYKKTILAKNISYEEINSVIDSLTTWMESNGKISAPAIILSRCSPLAKQHFKSHGIIQEQNNIISFCHQIYLDYLVAEKLILEIFAGGDILTWLGPLEKQSLFRREQLKQALFLLSGESPSTFVDVVKNILGAKEVRFHMKHLVLEIVSQLDDLSCMPIADYILSLLTDSYWNKHIQGTVLYGSKPWMMLLLRNGDIQDWLTSQDQARSESALWLLGSIMEKMPDAVAEALSPFADMSEDWANRILRTLGWNVENDSDSLFNLRLRLAQKGFITDFIDWKKLSQKNPYRALQLIAVILQLLLEECETKSLAQRKGRLEKWYDHDTEALNKAAEVCALEAWDLLIPIIEEMTLPWPETPYDPKATSWLKDRLEHPSTCVERGSVELLIKAGQTLAKNAPDLLIARTKSLESSASPVIQEILIESYTLLPPSHADTGISWLLNDLCRLQIGDGFTEDEWAPATRLIKALSPNCSDPLFRQLEDTLVHYHDPDEKIHAEYYLKEWRRGVYGDFWGRTQYHLLPILPPSRLAHSTSDLIKVVNRKFNSYPKWRFMRSGNSMAGFVGSTIHKNITKISDRAWLKIVTDCNIPYDGVWDHKRSYKDHIVESSISQFSRSLETIASPFPERFGKLALQFPPNTHHDYVEAIINALSLTQPKDNGLPEVKDSWEPASIGTVLAVLEKFQHYMCKESALEFSRLVQSRASESWPDWVLNELERLALDSGDTRMMKIDDSANSILTASLNCVRGVACNAISALLWDHPHLLTRFRPCIERLLLDDNPVILAATIRILLPILNIDKPQAVEWFCQAAASDVRLPSTHFAAQFINYTVREYSDHYIPFLNKMLQSKNQEAAKTAAHMASAYNMFYGFYEKEAAYSLNQGSPAHRQGVAQTAVANIDNPDFAPRCREYIAILMNDPDNKVRSTVSGMFRKAVFEVPGNIAFVSEYVTSKAFAQESYGLFHTLEEHKESLLPFANIILDTCTAVVNVHLKEGEGSNMRIGSITHGLPPLLLRLYEQAIDNNPKVACRCLDVWDQLFEHRIGSARDLTKKFEQ